MAVQLYGRNAVREALQAGRRTCQRLVVAAQARKSGTLAEILDLAQHRNIAVAYVDRQVLDTQLRHANHQGVSLHASDYPYSTLEDCLECAAAQHEAALLLLLDHVQDPQNIGTLLRTAAVVGVHGVLMPSRRAPGITPAVVNASSGATEHLQIALVSNIAQTILTLQQEQIWVVGIEDDPRAAVFDQVDLDRALALVAGAEDQGLARLTRERCDFLVRLPMRGAIASLNVAVAGSILLYHAWRQRAHAEAEGK